MLLRLAPALTAVALCAAAPAFAYDDTGRHDDTRYPEAHATFATAVDSDPIVSPDVAYPGAHVAIVKTLAAAPLAGAIAAFDDTTYPAADRQASPAMPTAAEQPQLATRTAQETAPCSCCRG